MLEHGFTHAGSYTNPYTQAEVTATLTHVGTGQTRSIPLFWDGGSLSPRGEG